MYENAWNVFTSLRYWRPRIKDTHFYLELLLEVHYVELYFTFAFSMPLAVISQSPRYNVLFEKRYTSRTEFWRTWRDFWTSYVPTTTRYRERKTVRKALKTLQRELLRKTRLENHLACCKWITGFQSPGNATGWEQLLSDIWILFGTFLKLMLRELKNDIRSADTINSALIECPCYHWTFLNL